MAKLQHNPDPEAGMEKVVAMIQEKVAAEEFNMATLLGVGVALGMVSSEPFEQQLAAVIDGTIDMFTETYGAPE